MRFSAAWGISQYRELPSGVSPMRIMNCCSSYSRNPHNNLDFEKYADSTQRKLEDLTQDKEHGQEDSLHPPLRAQLQGEFCCVAAVM